MAVWWPRRRVPVRLARREPAAGAVLHRLAGAPASLRLRAGDAVRGARVALAQRHAANSSALRRDRRSAARPPRWRRAHSRKERAPDGAPDRAGRRQRIPRIRAAGAGAARRHGRDRRPARAWRCTSAPRQRRDRGLPSAGGHPTGAALLHERRRARTRRADDGRHPARWRMGAARTGNGNRDMRHSLLASAVVAGMATTAQAQSSTTSTRADTAALHRNLDAIAKAHHGVLGYSVLNLDTGERLSLRGDETFPTASLIKVPILVTLYDLAEKKELSLDDPLTVLKIDHVPGTGVLQFMHPGMTLSVHDAAALMSILSDNTATNLILDKVAIRRVWQKMEALGLPHTKVHSKTYLRITSVAMDSSIKYGLGVSTPNEMAHLFELLAEGKAVSPAADSSMLDILRNNADGELMQRTVEGVSAPHKTGETDSVRTECALFRLQSRVVACGFTKQNTDIRWVVDNEAQVRLGKLGAAIVAGWPKQENTPARTRR